jgi:DEAD/DEAH box helicase domain-containing protein
VEATVFDPQNPYVLAPQLCCAAAELPLRPHELGLFAADGGAESSAAVSEVLDALVAQGALRRRPAGWFWTQPQRPSTDIRGTGGGPITVVESGNGALVGTVDAGAAHSTVHEGAVYLHQGRSFVVDQLDLEERVALVRPDEPPWSTSARDITDIAIVATATSRRYGPLTVSLGTVDVTNQVVSFVRRQLATGELIDEQPLDLPARDLRTSAVWYTLPQEVLDEVGLDFPAVPGAVHAAEHAAIGLLPLFATCDRWDIGGVSTALHPDTGRPTVFVYDGHPGGAGFAERGHDAVTAWLQATHDAIAACECARGCPSCVQSPKCGNGNEPLDKAGAITVLDLVLRHLSEA